MVQGGDYTNHDGTGGTCSPSTSSCPLGLPGKPGKFKDEKFNVIPHDGPGVVSMANSGPDTNGSQFFVTLGKCKHLDGKHVSFGRVVEGMHVLRKMEKVDTEGDRPVIMERVRVEEAYEKGGTPGRKRVRDDGGSEEEEEVGKKGKKSKKEKKKKKSKKEKKKKSKKDKKKKSKKDKKKKSKSRKRSSSDSSSSSDAEGSSSDDSSDSGEVLRSSITGKKIKMRIERTDEDIIKERERDALRDFLNG
jgi:cyclophilin family peptidyl-prolyl cis-trans isomerase